MSHPYNFMRNLLGIDLGNWSCNLIHVDDDIDIGISRTSVYTYISQIKCLLGRKFSDPELQLELDYVPFKVIEGPNGYPLIHGRCKGEDRAFSPVEILAMLISRFEFQARKEYCVSSPCIGIPIYFTDQQQIDVLQAASISGSSENFCLLDETTAMVVALERNLVMEPDCMAAFVDFGHASMQVCFAEFKFGSCRNPYERAKSVNILYKGYSRSLGGREFDKVLFQHFASNIRKEHNIDVYENCSACVRLREACESLKKDLSKNYEASFCIEKFSDSIDVKGSITRKEFENLSISILVKIQQALMKSVTESGLDVGCIRFVEEVGRGCSIPAISNILTKIFGVKLRKCKSYYEYIARGCAMQAEPLDIIGTDKVISNLTSDAETSQLVSGKLSSEVEQEDAQKYLWRKAMDKEGHLLTFLNEFLEENLDSIRRSEKTRDESYWLGEYAEYSYSELQDATNNFDDSCKLGEGGFGIVYKGILRTVTVAIKVMKQENNQGAEEFTQEVEILRKVSHPNLVKLIGSCQQTCALIYEYLPNGSLEDRLRCKNNTPPLSWQARVRIAFEICSALSFLHSTEPHGIVHAW